MMAVMSSTVVYADDIVITIKTDGGNVHPRTGVPITASIEVS